MPSSRSSTPITIPETFTQRGAPGYGGTSAMSVFSVARGCEGFHLRVYGDGPVLSDVKRYFRPDAESGQAAWALPGNDMRTISPRDVRSRSSISPPWPLTTSRAIDSPRPNPLRFAELRALSPL